MNGLDLFSGAGGASMGLHRAGFTMTGVDIKRQPHYPFKFIQADALTFPLDGFDFIWASPPCQAFTSLKSMWNAKTHANLIPPIRERLKKSGMPYVIENVPGSPLSAFTMLCGTMFDLHVGDAELWRHRYFEHNFMFLSPSCLHKTRPRVIGVYGGHGRDRRRHINTQDYSTADRRKAMGIDWMNGNELSESIPPAYSEFIGVKAREAFERLMGLK